MLKVRGFSNGCTIAPQGFSLAGQDPVWVMGSEMRSRVLYPIEERSQSDMKKILQTQINTFSHRKKVAIQKAQKMEPARKTQLRIGLTRGTLEKLKLRRGQDIQSIQQNKGDISKLLKDISKLKNPPNTSKRSKRSKGKRNRKPAQKARRLPMSSGARAQVNTKKKKINTLNRNTESLKENISIDSEKIDRHETILRTQQILFEKRQTLDREIVAISKTLTTLDGEMADYNRPPSRPPKRNSGGGGGSGGVGVRGKTRVAVRK
jgi:hypothetical protein